MGRFNEDDILEYERARQHALRRLDFDGDSAGKVGCFLLLLVAGLVAWLHNIIAKVTGPELAGQILWVSIPAAVATVVWLFLKRRNERAKAEQRAQARGRGRARDVIVRAQAERPGLLADFWTTEGERQHGAAALVDFDTAVQLVINVYGIWTILALSAQGHDRLLEDDIIAVFGDHRGVRVTQGVWAALNAE
jgi:predicted permease